MISSKIAEAKALLPISVRAEAGRLRRSVNNHLSPVRIATHRGKKESFKFQLAESASPLNRGVDPKSRLQIAKETNVSIAAPLINSAVLFPGEVFSYHALVGRPSRRRGFLPGPELRDGKLLEGLGGGCCQISNMLYLLAIKSGLAILERHRHGLDLFPDKERTVPFGCGATVFYNYRDLRFQNNLSMPVYVALEVKGGYLAGKFLATEDPDFRVMIIERDHRFFMRGADTMRENRIFRAFTDRDGNKISEELLAHNRCRVVY